MKVESGGVVAVSLGCQGSWPSALVSVGRARVYTCPVWVPTEERWERRGLSMSVWAG